MTAKCDDATTPTACAQDSMYVVQNCWKTYCWL